MSLIKHHQPEITKEQPFEHCQLDRGKYAEILTNVIDSADEGFVLALNSEWGSGKSTFIKMWQKHLDNNEFKTIYLNVWENDYSGNPMTEIIAELKKLLTKTEPKKITSFLKKASIVGKATVPTILKAVANKYVETEQISEVIKKLSEASFDIFQEEIKEYSQKKENIAEFKKELNHVLLSISEKPIIFFIDELDRCRPSYAVEFLEHIKHFFEVENIVFVLSIDKTQLEHSICGFYGSENLNSTEYLRRFIDIEYTLPAPSTEKFVSYLYEYYNFNDFFKERIDSRNVAVQHDHKNLQQLAAYIFKIENTTLRQQEKIMAQLRIVLKSFNKTDYIKPLLLFYLLYIRNYHNEYYSAIIYRKLDIQELIQKFENLFPIENTKINHQFRLTLVQLIVCYHNFLKDNNQNSQSLLEKSEDNLTTKLVSNLLKSSLARAMEDELRSIDTYSVDMQFLTDRIDMLEHIVS